MIPFDFAYYQPATIEEALSVFQELEAAGKNPIYYGGGTEIISLARLNQLATEAVIDIKAIPELNVLKIVDNRLHIGAAVTLTQINESHLFPLLGETAARVADHTIQDKITLGGNLAGQIIYREAVLPLLLTDCQVTIAGMEGLRSIPIDEVFNERLHLANGELLIQVAVDLSYIAAPRYHVKKTKLEKIDYPLLTVAALKIGGQIRVGFSGLAAYPFRSAIIENDLNMQGTSYNERIDNAINHLPAPVINDIRGSAAYREFVLRNTLLEVLADLGGKEAC